MFGEIYSHPAMSLGQEGKENLANGETARMLERDANTLDPKIKNKYFLRFYFK